jgi:hypothetical protein
MILITSLVKSSFAAGESIFVFMVFFAVEFSRASENWFFSDL